MEKPKRILFINHAGTLRGSSMSLLYTIEGLDPKRYHGMVVVAAPAGEVVQLYKENGLEAISAPDIIQWHFSTVAPRPFFVLVTWREIFKFIFGQKLFSHAMDEIISKLKPDLVHLNSMALSPSALYLKKHNIPFVWHVREPPQMTSSFSFRRRLIGKWLRELPGASIFLSEYDRQTWTGSKNGHVIPNFVNFSTFDHKIPSTYIKKELNIPDDSPVLLFVGGLRSIKGIFTLIRALKLIVKEYPDLRCIMPGADYNPPHSFVMYLARTAGQLTNYGPTGLRAIKMIQKFDLKDICIRLPYRNDMPYIIAAVDIVVFPSTKPHFARPVVEASAMGKAVVASNLPGVCELVIDGVTGLLVPPGNHEVMASSVCELLRDPARRRSFGENGYQLARKHFSRSTACERIMSIYDDILNRT